jgi:DNA-binding beta-propeller fold protein YncE
MKPTTRSSLWAAIGISLSALLVIGSAAAGLRVKVIVDNASIKATPEIGGQTLANSPLGTVLDVELKQGEWYKIKTTKGGASISGYIHELLVEELAEGEVPAAPASVGPIKSQGEISAEIELKIEESKSLIRQEKELDRAAEELRPLLAKAFSLDDHPRQKQVACEIYLWLGLASAKRGDKLGAFREFQNMFDVDYAYAKEVTRNVYDPTVSSFIDQAERHYRGLLVDYSLEITTEPKEASIRIDGREVGLTPEVYRSPVPQFTLEIVKEGYKTYKEEVFLSEANSKKEIVLQSSGRTILVGSVPPGAQVFLDGQDTGKITDCELPYVAYGAHSVKLTKPHWADSEHNIELLEGVEPLTIAAALTVKDYVPGVKIGSPQGKTFKLPRAMAIDKEGFLYVADESDVKIKKYDTQGRLQSGWGDAGRPFRVLKRPSGMAIDALGYIYVTDAEASCVMKFTKNGNFVSKWGKPGAKPGELMGPLGIAVDRGGDLYVADSGNHRIVKYSTGGVAKLSWGKQGLGRGEFISPTAVAVDSRNEIVVVDRVHIQRFTTEGEVTAAWGKSGTGDGEWTRAQGLSVDGHDYIYLADTGNNRVQKFDPNGRFIVKWGSPGTGDGQMLGPVSVVTGESGSVFVLELENNRAQEFKLPS